MSVETAASPVGSEFACSSLCQIFKVGPLRNSPWPTPYDILLISLSHTGWLLKSCSISPRVNELVSSACFHVGEQCLAWISLFGSIPCHFGVQRLDLATEKSL